MLYLGARLNNVVSQRFYGQYVCIISYTENKRLFLRGTQAESAWLTRDKQTQRFLLIGPSSSCLAARRCVYVFEGRYKGKAAFARNSSSNRLFTKQKLLWKCQAEFALGSTVIIAVFFSVRRDVTCFVRAPDTMFFNRPVRYDILCPCISRYDVLEPVAEIRHCSALPLI